MSAASPFHRLYESVRRRHGLVATVVVAYAVAGQFLLREWNLSELRIALGAVALVLGLLVALVNLQDIREATEESR
ncbi:hypothetical protein [Halospeciosus flavus]|uniref:Uncharacterized protein n=1 Tax=Halospeciosus flavus TaxID=3032283 RepID=A0ABD5Z561_9EURY|nr:hypothetical protein [Halospeciosus flavus]